MQEALHGAEHLTPALVRDYRNRALAPELLLAVTTHLARCEECRQEVAPSAEMDRLAQALGSEHLHYDDLEALVLGGRQGLNHVASCNVCAAELADLRAFVQTSPAPARKWQPLRILVPGLACALLILISVRLRPSPPIPQKPLAPATVAVLRDAGQMISLDGSGALHGFDNLAPEERAQLATALREGILPAPRSSAALSGRREILLSAPAFSYGTPNPNSEGALSPVAPLGTVVSSALPVFHWHAAPGTTAFRVAVYTADFELAEASPALRTPEWTATRPLRRGQTYTWTVTGILKGQSVTVPHAPEPEARFRVATADEARIIEALLQARPPSELRLALAAIRLGMTDDAAEALRRLARDNPGAPLIARWQESLRKAAK